MSEDFNMSMRKAGDTSGKSFEAKMVLTIEGVDLEHVVTGKIEGK